MKKKSKYFCELSRATRGVAPHFWKWDIICINGVNISDTRNIYINKAQCRNTGKKFAKSVGLEWRENEKNGN